MNKEDFIRALRKRVADTLGDSVIVGESLLPVNNRRPANALEIWSKESRAGICINSEPHYEAFRSGVELEWIAEYICRQYNRQAANNPMLTDPRLADIIIHFFSDFRIVRKRIVFRLVNAVMNEERLKDIPHIRILDLAMVFGINMGNSEDSSTWSGITYDKMKKWGIGKDDLLKAALKNTPSICPVAMDDMNSILLKMVEQDDLDEELRTQLQETLRSAKEKVPMYVLSNSLGIHGAGALLYPGVLRGFADSIGGNLIILPSSVHETILVPETEEVDIEDMKDMVMDINRNEVAKEAWLADNAYLYDREQDCIKAVGHGAPGEPNVFYLAELEDTVKEVTYDEAV